MISLHKKKVEGGSLQVKQVLFFFFPNNIKINWQFKRTAHISGKMLFVGVQVWKRDIILSTISAEAFIQDCSYSLKRRKTG